MRFPLPPIAKILDDLGVPDRVRPVLPVVKAASAMGLLSVSWFPALARLTTAMLTLYFVLAIGAHIRARDKVVNALPAASFLATFAVMTVKGPDRALVETELDALHDDGGSQRSAGHRPTMPLRIAKS